VILITTKTGNNANARTSLNFYTGVQQARNIPVMLNAKQYAKAVNDYFDVFDEDPEYTDAEINALGAGTNWIDEILRVAPIQSYQLSTQGGNESFKYYASGGYFGQQGIIRNSRLDRYSLTLNMEKQVNDKWIITNNSILSYTDHEGVISEGGYSNTGVSSAIYTALQYNPTAAIFDVSGNYAFSPTMESSRLSNPVAIVNEVSNEAKIVRVLENLAVNYRITPHLKLKISGGLDFMTNKESFYETRQVLEGRDNDGLARLGSIQNYGFLNENTLTYDKTFASRHQLNVLAGFTYQANRSESMNASAKGFVTDGLGAGNLGSASGMLPAGSNIV